MAPRRQEWISARSMGTLSVCTHPEALGHWNTPAQAMGLHTYMHSCKLSCGRSNKMVDVEMGEAAMPSAAEIFKAAETGQTELFEGLSPHQLLQLCSLRNEDSRSPLHVAASAGQAQIVRVLCGVSDPSQSIVNIEDEEGWTALHSAVSSGHVSITQILLEAGANVSAVNNGGRTALHYAASKGWTKLAEILIEHGANVNQMDKFGCTPLHRAASASRPEVCELLLEEGANVDMADKTGQTPLMYATICNDKQVSLLLIRHGADVDAEDKEGYTVLGRASDELRPALIDAAKVMLEG